MTLHNTDKIIQNNDEVYDEPTQEEVDKKFNSFLKDPYLDSKIKFMQALTQDDEAWDALWTLVKTHIRQDSSSYCVRTIATRAEEIINEMIIEGDI